MTNYEKITREEAILMISNLKKNANIVGWAIPEFVTTIIKLAYNLLGGILVAHGLYALYLFIFEGTVIQDSIHSQIFLILFGLFIFCVFLYNSLELSEDYKNELKKLIRPVYKDDIVYDQTIPSNGSKYLYKIIDIDSARDQYKMIDLSIHVDIIKKSNELINFVTLDDSSLIKKYKMIS